MDIQEFLGWVSDARIHKLYNFWVRSCGTHVLPAQEDLDLVTIPQLLPHVFIIDAEGPNDFRYRFLGTQVDLAIGRSVTGRLISEFRTGRTLVETIAFFRRIMENREMGVMRTQLPSETHEWMQYTRFGIPLADDHVTPNKIFGLLKVDVAVNHISAPPTVFEAEQDERGHVERHFACIAKTSQNSISCG